MDGAVIVAQFCRFVYKLYIRHRTHDIKIMLDESPIDFQQRHNNTSYDVQH